MQEVFLAIEIGGTKLQLVTGNAAGEVQQVVRCEVRRELGASGIRDRIETEVARLRRDFRFRRVGVGFGGPVDYQSGRVAVSHQIEGWSGFGLATWLEEISGAPVRVDNDANIAALGEAVRGAGAGKASVFYVTLGSGVGGGFVQQGRVFHGAYPGECEIGHLRLDRGGTTVESRCSGWAMDARIRSLPEADRGSEIWRRTRAMEGGESKEVSTALAAGDTVAGRLLKELAGDLAFALSHVVHLQHPEVIVIGGGLSQVGEPLRAQIASALPQHLMKVFLPGPEIVLAALGENAVPVGALLLAGAG